VCLIANDDRPVGDVPNLNSDRVDDEHSLQASPAPFSLHHEPVLRPVPSPFDLSWCFRHDLAEPERL
jgi:hypothetical protein